jgi:hypothetical protein
MVGSPARTESTTAVKVTIWLACSADRESNRQITDHRLVQSDEIRYHTKKERPFGGHSAFDVEASP